MNQTTTIRSLTVADAAAFCNLLNAVGWQQNPERAAVLIQRSAGLFRGIFVGSTLVGSAAAHCYESEKLAFFHNVAVHPAHRRNGYATRLMEDLLKSLSDCRSFRLYATGDGEKLYSKFGFQLYTHVLRYHRNHAPSDIPDEALALAEGSSPMRPNDLNSVAELDYANFHARRGDLLENLYRTNSRHCRVIQASNGTLDGFAMILNGHIGPLEAKSVHALRQLLFWCLAQKRTHTTIDVMADQSAVCRFLAKQGFAPPIKLAAMQKGIALPPPGQAYIAPFGCDIG